jgi:hypothetical protein
MGFGSFHLEFGVDAGGDGYCGGGGGVADSGTVSQLDGSYERASSYKGQ